MTRFNLLILLVMLTPISCASSVAIKQINDLNIAYRDIIKSNPNPDSTLVIFDIDDTLLQPNNFVGSDSWYAWQRGREVLDKQGKVVPIADKDKFNCIFGALGTLFELNTTRLTQQDAPKIVNALKIYNMLVLTSRTYGFRSATERELRSHGILVADKHLLPKEQGLEFILENDAPTAKITYKNGIVLSSGRNKGKVLKALLQRLNRSYEQIYFIDDSPKNVNNMAVEWADAKSNMTIYHYTKIDKTVTHEEIAQSIAAKKAFDQFLRIAFPDRAQAFEEDRCH